MNLTQKDIVRHKLVTRIVNAYDKYDKAKEKEKEENNIKKAQRREHFNDEEEFTIFEKIDNDIN